MKQTLYIIILLFLPLTLPAQSTNQNYILNRTYLTADGASYNDHILYFDGLGRTVQTVQKGITPTGKDLIDITEYDRFGRLTNVRIMRLRSSIPQLALQTISIYPFYSERYV